MANAMEEYQQKYKDYVMTGFLKSVAPIVFEKASGCVVTDINGKEYLDCFCRHLGGQLGALAIRKSMTPPRPRWISWCIVRPISIMCSR